MKKLLAAVMAGAIVASMASVASFAAAATHGKAVITLVGTVATASTETKLVFDSETFSAGNGLATTATVDDIGTAIIANYSSSVYTASYNASSDELTLTRKAAGATSLVATVTPTNFTGGPTTARLTNGTNATGYDFAPILVTGTPLVEGTGDMSGTDTIKPGTTVYYALNQSYMNDGDLKVKVGKGEGAKNIDSVKLVEKNFTSALISTVSPYGAVAGTTGRKHFVAVKLKDNMTDAEYKVAFDIKVSAKDTVTLNGITYSTGEIIKSEDVGTTWVTNQGKTGDTDWNAGTGGFIAKPTKNDDNEVLWTDNNRDIAKLTFTADSDVSKYYPKLSTKWGNDVYAANFADGEAFKFEFVGTPAISSTSRPLLTIYNPFVNSDDEYTVAVEDLTVYELVDGEFVDATAKFTAGTNDDGDEVLTTKTRTLGYYVVCDEAAATSDVIDGGDEPIKDLPNTGR